MYGAQRGLFAILLYVQIFEEDRWACQMRVDFRLLLSLSPVEIYFSDKTRQKEKKCWCQTNLAKLKAGGWRTLIFILHFKWCPDE
jgi:hypothetical protein